VRTPKPSLSSSLSFLHLTDLSLLSSNHHHLTPFRCLLLLSTLSASPTELFPLPRRSRRSLPFTSFSTSIFLPSPRPTSPLLQFQSLSSSLFTQEGSQPTATSTSLPGSSISRERKGGASSLRTIDFSLEVERKKGWMLGICWMTF